MTDIDDIRRRLAIPGAQFGSADVEALVDELFRAQSARKSLFNALADIVKNWDGDETEDYIVGKLTLVQWNEAKPFAELDGDLVDRFHHEWKDDQDRHGET